MAAFKRLSRYRKVVIVITLASTVGPLFGASFSIALGRQVPHRLPVGLAGGETTLSRAAVGLQSGSDGGIAFHRYTSSAGARRAIARQTIYGALVGPGSQAQLLVSSADGTSVARVLEDAARHVSIGSGHGLPVTDVHPLPSNDPLGLIPFYLTLASTVTGFVSMLTLHANAPKLTLRGWLACVLAVAVGAGLLLTVLIDPVIGGLRSPFLELWGITAAGAAASALWCSTMLAVSRAWALVPTFGLLMILGIPSSGGPAAPQLMPRLYAVLNHVLPPGAMVRAIRNSAYFRHSQHLEPFLVLAVWIAGLLVALFVIDNIAGVSPGADLGPTKADEQGHAG